MIHGYGRVLLEGDAVETGGESEDALYDLRELQIRAQHLRVDVVFLQLQFVRVVGGVPRHHVEVVALHLPCLGAQFVALLYCRRLVGIYKLIEQVIDILGVARHALLQHIVGIGLEAQELCHLAAQVDQSLAYLEVVSLVLVCALGVARHIQLLAQRAVLGILHEGTVGRAVEGDNPSLLATLLSRLARRLYLGVGQSVEVFLVGYVQGERLILFQHILRELQREHTRLLSECAQAFLALLVEQCT